MNFLPPGTLSDGLVPIHIPLNRYDGRTKDYMVSSRHPDEFRAESQYIEVASGEAARKVLQKCQNAFMPGGPLTQPRARAVTITQVPYSELVKEVSCHGPCGLGIELIKSATTRIGKRASSPPRSLSSICTSPCASQSYELIRRS
jgi:hypothetical protein